MAYSPFAMIALAPRQSSGVSVFDDMPVSIRLDREEAGLRQLIMAITMLRLGRYECAITLAEAAEELFPLTAYAAFNFLKHDSPPPCMEDHPWAKKTPRERGDALNKVRNWLKHSNSPDVRDITLDDAEVAIVRAFTRAHKFKLEVMMPDWAVEPWNWFLAQMGVPEPDQSDTRS